MSRLDFREAGGVATAPVVDRQLPYSPEAEIAVLGGMLIDPDAVAKAIEVVDDAMFYREPNRRLFRAMSRLFQGGQALDPVTVSEELKKTDELEVVGGLTYLAELLDAVPTAANLEYHARIVREKALLRRLIDASSQVIRDAYEVGERTVEEILDAAEQRIFQVAQSQEREGFVWIKKILYPTFEQIEKLQAAAGGITGVPSGFPDLDEMTGGFQKGDLVILAARPSMGKTSIVVGMALHAAIMHQTPVAIYSLEMSKEQIVQRMLCHEALVDLGRLLRGRLSDDDYVRLTGRRPPEYRPPLDRRHRLAQHHRDARQGAPPEGGRSQPRDDHPGLRAAHGRRERQGGEPPAGGQPDQPRPQIIGEGDRGPDHRPLPALPRAGTADRPPPSALRPA
jgi:replicative DNA helicase